MKRKITMTVDEKVFAAFKEFCRKNAMKVSSKVELLMRDTVERSEPGEKPDENGNGREGAK